MNGARSRSRLLLLALAALALLAMPSVAHATPNYDWPGMKKCGTFQAEYRIWVYAKNMRCAKAWAIQKEFWLGPDSRKIVVNGARCA